MFVITLFIKLIKSLKTIQIYSFVYTMLESNNNSSKTMKISMMSGKMIIMICLTLIVVFSEPTTEKIRYKFNQK